MTLDRPAYRASVGTKPNDVAVGVFSALSNFLLSQGSGLPDIMRHRTECPLDLEK